MTSPMPSPEALLAEVATLRRELVKLQSEKAELELLMEMTTEYSDEVADELFDTVEATQQESEQRFEVITNTVPVPILVSRVAEDVIVYANTAAGELTGMASEALLGQGIVEFYSNAGERKRILATVDKEGHVNNWEIRGKQIGGNVFWAAVFIRPLVFNAEPGLLEVYYDLTASKEAEVEILRLQHLLQNITDSMPSALITLNPTGRVLTWNPAAERLTGQTSNRVMGRLLWTTCPNLARYRDLFEQVVKDNQVIHQHREQWAANGGSTHYEISIFPLADDLKGAVLRIDDVTERVQLEEMMFQSAKMASVGGLAAGVAHEINNPLSGLLQSAQMLQMALDIDRPRTRERLQGCGIDPLGLARYLNEQNLPEYLAGIRSTGERAARIVTDLLSFSRKSSSQFVPHDLNSLVEQILALAAADYDLKKRYDFRNLEIILELSPGLPLVICDGPQVEQVVLNLVRNAAQALTQEQKYRRERGKSAIKRGRLTLRTSLVPSGSWVRLEVEDNGPGIPEELRTRLFEPFFTTKAMGEGTGLGLWLCWTIVVERHKGRIWAEPVQSHTEAAEIESGTRFIVELPIGEA
ncbi:MAG: PAS domain S-box protein [Anaerolineae bacterium]|nr:PAS domain S-box protein [Anaerolineae bacterium]